MAINQIGYGGVCLEFSTFIWIAKIQMGKKESSLNIAGMQ